MSGVLKKTIDDGEYFESLEKEVDEMLEKLGIEVTDKEEEDEQNSSSETI